MNLNDPVWVRLNEWGWKVFDDHHRRLGLDPEPYRKMIGLPPSWQKFQLWQLMEVFGPTIHHGGPVPFDGNELRLEQPEVAPR